MYSAADVKVEAYGTLATLASIAQVSVRDPRALLVSVFDSAMATPVERAIRSAGLNLNPSVDSGGAGRILVPVPRPTRETREAMRKVRRFGARPGLLVEACAKRWRRTCVLVLALTGRARSPSDVQTAMKEAENARVAARHVRRSAMDAIKRVKGEIPSDEFKRLEKDVQGITDEAVSTIDTAIALKLKVIDRP